MGGDGQINERAFDYYGRLNRVREYVAANYWQRIRLDDAARVACLEKKYFSAYFRAKVGVTFLDWVTRVRIERAKMLLRSENRTVQAVALAVGYPNLRTFERAFQRCTGESPVQFKRGAEPG